MSRLSISRNASAMPEIGGFFELALPDFGDPFPSFFLRFQSARSALRAVLEGSEFARVLLPAYICDSVVRAVSDAGRTPEFYRLDAQLAPVIPVAVPEDTALLCVNYFGLCDDIVARVKNKVAPSQLIIDNTQALFAPPMEVFGSIYSPRKFVGLPDGGFLATRGPMIALPTDEDHGSMGRMEHLLVRMAGTARDGYSSFMASGCSLEDTRPLRMSRLTNRLLRSIDMQVVKSRRRANFARLARAFDPINARRWTLGRACVPLCYPLVLEKDVTDVRKLLADSNIYIPAYWEDARQRIEDDSVEKILLDNCLSLPCDQRYTAAHIDRLIDCVSIAVKRRGAAA
jgi:hypothetical protein